MSEAPTPFDVETAVRTLNGLAEYEADDDDAAMLRAVAAALPDLCDPQRLKTVATLTLDDALFLRQVSDACEDAGLHARADHLDSIADRIAALFPPTSDLAANRVNTGD